LPEGHPPLASTQAQLFTRNRILRRKVANEAPPQTDKMYRMI